MRVDMSVTQPKYQEVIATLDKALARFQGPPLEEGFDLEIYEELRRIREILIRAERDLRDKNVPSDSRSPLGSS
jgi:hypothetical protein